MKRWVFLILINLLFAACSAPADDTQPVEVTASVPTGATAQVEATTAGTATDEPGVEVEDEGNAQRYLEAVPPAGQWTWTVLDVDASCSEGDTITILGADPVVVTLELSEDAKTMTLELPEGTAVFTQEMVNIEGDTRTSHYKGSLYFGEIEIVYELEYNLDEDGLLTGFTGNPNSDCPILRPLTAEYVAFAGPDAIHRHSERQWQRSGSSPMKNLL